MSLELEIILPGFLACLLLTGFLAYLGLHVLAREVIFVDIALAQIAALGMAVASLFDVEPHSPTSYLCSLAFTFVGAGLFALTRGLRKRVPQEAFIGITYAVAAAGAILVAKFLAHGDEQIKELLIGSLLTVTLTQVGVTALIFSALAVLHVIFRRKFIEMSFERADHEDWRAMLWDLLFYASFGVVITSSVHMAGVLLVFSFLIVPAVFSALFTKRLPLRLLIAWVLGAIVSAFGLWGSFKLDLPTGAAVVVTFGIALVLGAAARAVLDLGASMVRRRDPAC